MPCSGTKSISPFTAARTCRSCFPTGCELRACCPVKIREMRWCFRLDRVHRHVWSEALTVENEEALRSALRQALTVGTSSVRRVAQLMRILPDARFAAIRGNLDTRLRKLDEGQYDALILAAAGLRRLGFGSRISFPLPVTTCVPAPGQGIVAVEIRADDRHAQSAVAPISDRLAEAALAAERAVVAGLGGGCQTPIGALALPFGEMLQLVAVVVSLDGARALRTEATGQAGDAESLGAQAAERLVEQGANEILAESRVH